MSEITYGQLVEKVALAIDPWLTESDLVTLRGGGPFIGYSRADKAARATRRVFETIADALKEPTEAMKCVGAMEYAMCHQRVQTAESNAEDIFRAMLAASPLFKEGE